MQKILIAIAATLFVAGAAHAAETCEAQATAKKLAGAAKTSFMKKCEGDAKVSDAAAACEAQAKEKGYEVNVAKFPFTANAKAHGLGDATGFVKLISDKKYGEMLGAHLIGPDVTELLPELTLARYAELTPEEIARNVHAHPTLSEAVKEAAHGLVGHFINF